MPITSGIALFLAWKMSRDHRSAAAAMPSTAREQAAEANTRRRVLNLQELNRSWWKLVRNISGVNFVVGMFVAFVVVFQINAQGKPELMEAVASELAARDAGAVVIYLAEQLEHPLALVL